MLSVAFSSFVSAANDKQKENSLLFCQYFILSHDIFTGFSVSSEFRVIAPSLSVVV